MIKYKETKDRMSYLERRRSNNRSEYMTRLITERWAKEDGNR